MTQGCADRADGGAVQGGVSEMHIGERLGIAQIPVNAAECQQNQLVGVHSHFLDELRRRVSASLSRVAEDEEGRALAAHDRVVKASETVQRAMQAADDAREAHASLQNAEKQTARQLELTQLALDEANMVLTDLQATKQRHREWLNERLQQQRAAVSEAVQTLQGASRKLHNLASSANNRVIQENILEVNSAWVNLTVEQRKLHELAATYKELCKAWLGVQAGRSQ
eukprot:TRINITY_DN71079_c0_g2_i1.p1 TRINITY_DN71079_c0_g2~~TRINITY_DN71079_c0_g2_i1.p1  ORF type:complete len:226 (-),score=18.92 TRINITY_DN71079_c0_g2_i1:37-714(-)